MKLIARLPLAAILASSLLVGGASVAQLEGSDRGVPPIDSSSTFEVTGIDVDVSAAAPEKAREAGWREAQARGWKALWAKTNGRPLAEAPSLPDSTLNGMVAGIVIEQEQIGPKRYIATLGVLFDRARAGALLGVGGIVRRSAPLLVVPLLWTGGSFTSFEYRNEWQKAWARFRTGNSPVDYVRPTGSGIDPLLLNAAQAGRPGRGWWRMLLQQYGASDLLVPEARLKRLWPGGPAIGTFIARRGADGRILGAFTLRVETSAALPKLLDEGVRRLDQIYASALEAGELSPDPTLRPPPPPPPPEVAEAPPPPPVETSTAAPPVLVPGAAAIVSLTIQVATPDAESVSRAELAVSRIPGVASALTTSLALGGVSVMKVTYAGDPAALADKLQAAGWQVSGSGTNLRISKGGGD